MVMSNSKPTDFDRFNFHPMPKRFMIWDKEEKQFLTYLSSKSVDFEYLLVLIDHYNITLSELGSRYVLIQSTNLFDKDGEEIFEGSILYLYSESYNGLYDVPNTETVYVTQEDGNWICRYADGSFCSRLSEVLDDNDEVTILGHILSNPELLEKCHV